MIGKEQTALASFGFDEEVNVIAVEFRAGEHHWHCKYDRRCPVDEDGSSSEEEGGRKKSHRVEDEERNAKES